MLIFTIFLDRLFIILVHAFGNCIWELNDEKVISLKRRLYIFSFLYLLLSHFIVFFIVCIFFAKYKHPIPLFNKYSRGTCTYTRSMILIMILKNTVESGIHDFGVCDFHDTNIRSLLFSYL